MTDETKGHRITSHQITNYQNPAAVCEERRCGVCKTIACAAKDTYRNRAQIPGKNLLPKRVFVST